MYVTLGPNEMAYPCNLSTREAKVGPGDHFISKKKKKKTKVILGHICVLCLYGTQEVEAGSQLQLYTKFEASLGYIRCCFKEKQTNKQERSH